MPVERADVRARPVLLAQTTRGRADRPKDADRREALETDLGEFRRDEVGICVGVNHGRADVAVAEQPL